MIKTSQKILIILAAIAAIIGMAWYINVYKLRKVESPDKFIASIEPVRFLITKIVGTDFDVTTLLPSGASAETYEPTSKQIVYASASKAIFTTGLIDFENVIVEKVVLNSTSKIVNLSDGIELIAGHEHGSDEDHDPAHHHGVDPHIWASPKTLRIMAQNVYSTISALYPNSLKYQFSYLELLKELDAADAAITEKIASSDVKYFLIYHPALTYYSADYEIKQVALEQDGKEPSVAYLTPIVDKARKDSVKVILYQKYLNPSIVESIAKDIGARPVEFDPLAGDVIDNLLWVTSVITQ